MRRLKTLFIDIDGVLVEQSSNKLWPELMAKGDLPALLPGTHEKLVEWDKSGHRIILTTGRRESTRRVTEDQLTRLGIFYDLLIMGLGTGPRVLINDLKPGDDQPMATAFNLKRNTGIGDLKV